MVNKDFQNDHWTIWRTAVRAQVESVQYIKSWRGRTLNGSGPVVLQPIGPTTLTLFLNPNPTLTL